MSMLKLFRPDTKHSSEPRPHVVSFRQPWESRKKLQLDEGTLRAISRAKMIRKQNACPECGCASVAPIELENPILNRNRLPIPGTASLVGFRCTKCEAEWPAENHNDDTEE